MAIAIVDLSKYAGKWIAQEENGSVVQDADTYAELKRALLDRGIDMRSVTITQVPKDDGALLL